MEFRFTENQERFRQEIRNFLEEELRTGGFGEADNQWMEGFDPEFSRKLGKMGWIGLCWPKRYGGQERDHLDRLIYAEEMLRYGAPVAAHWIAERQIGNSLLNFGSEEQRQEFLPPIARGELYFCLGLSEPGAGTDLAGIQTRAIEEGDEFVIEGQKIWTTLAHRCHYIWLLARTDPEAAKHRGLSEFMVDLSLPGITINGLIDLSGEHHVNEVFFDSVRVPRQMLVGEKNRGWYQIVRQVDHERSGLERLMSNHLLYERLLRHVKETGHNGQPLSRDATVRHKLASLKVEFEVGRLLVYRVAWLLSKGQVPNYEAALAKAYCTAYEQRLSNTMMQVLGLYGQLREGSKYAPLGGRPAKDYLISRAYTLRGGTSETLRNIVALRGLGLPSGG